MEPATISQIIKKGRERKHWSQGQLARKTGLSPKTISAIEQGVCAPSLKTFMKILDALDLKFKVE
jgi:transcriptional regulator with XRE-family HTH domain